MAQGVPIAVGVALPRLPALYEPKRRWLLPQQAVIDVNEIPDDATFEGALRANYSSVEQFLPAVRTALEDLHINKQALRMPLVDA